MITHLIEGVAATDDEPLRNSIGGCAILPTGIKWPQCDCGERMVLFFQFDIREEFGLPFIPKSHLTVFMCPAHNDAPEMFRKNQLPEKFWNRRSRLNDPMRFYELFLHSPTVTEIGHPRDPVLLPQRLKFMRHDEVVDNDEITLRQHPEHEGVNLSVGEVVGGLQGFKIGGQPSWAQDSELHRCCCGAEMRFLCQVPLNWPFAKRPEAPEQPDSFSNEDYGLFLGNETYLFACEAQCDPRAVHVVVQN